MITFSPVDCSHEKLRKYEALFAACFPPSAKFSPESLKWLYADNPDGKVIGFDAFEGEELAAHYVCIPSIIKVGGVSIKAALSLNTATHPKFQGQGLFTKLADKTYESAAESGFSAIYGVANANSTPGFIRKLGFQLVQPLDAKVGIGPLNVDFAKVAQAANFERIWTEDALNWRCSNPVNKIRQFPLSKGAGFYAKAFGNTLPAYAELVDSAPSTIEKSRPWSPARLYLGLHPAGSCKFSTYVDIPVKFRPSPLNMIFKSLGDSQLLLKSGEVHFTFMDFDAY